MNELFSLAGLWKTHKSILPLETFLHVWEGGLHKNVSQMFAMIDFLSGEIAGKTLSVRQNIIGNIKLGQTSHLNLDKFGISNDIPDCRSALLTFGHNFRIPLHTTMICFSRGYGYEPRIHRSK